MSKVLRVGQCKPSECPRCFMFMDPMSGSHYYLCRYARRIIEDTTKTFPRWCPLEDITKFKGGKP